MMLNIYWFFFLFSLYKKSSQQYMECECGKTDEFVPRIVGGRAVEENIHPWAVVLIYRGIPFCGASLINDRYILTAGHCLKSVKKEDLTVYMGITSLTDSINQTPYELESVYVHENFTSFELHDWNDIALGKLTRPVRFSSKIIPVCLPLLGKDYSGEKATVIGWGLSGENKSPSPLLMETQVKVLPKQVCRKNPIVGDKLIDGNLCAYGNHTDACQGDSGGPLLLKTPTDKMEQIGVVSWGIGCARKGIPGVYSSVSYYLDWILDHTLDARYCRLPE